MTLKIKSILSLLLAFLLTFAACSAAPHKERVQPPMGPNAFFRLRRA